MLSSLSVLRSALGSNSRHPPPQEIAPLAKNTVHDSVIQQPVLCVSVTCLYGHSLGDHHADAHSRLACAVEEEGVVRDLRGGRGKMKVRRGEKMREGGGSYV